MKVVQNAITRLIYLKPLFVLASALPRRDAVPFEVDVRHFGKYPDQLISAPLLRIPCCFQKQKKNDKEEAL